MQAVLNPPVAPASKPVLLDAAGDGLRLAVSVRYAPEIAAALKDAGCVWFAPRRAWLAPVERAESITRALLGAARALPHMEAAGLRARIDAATAAPQADLVAPLLDAQLMPVATGGVAIASLQDPVLARVLRAAGGVYQRQARAWSLALPRAQALDLLRDAAGIAPEYVFCHETAVTLEALAGGSANELPISVPAAAPPPLAQAGEPSGEGNAFLSVLAEPMRRLPVDEARLRDAASTFGLRDYQVEGVRHLLARSSALLADDMGLGKSRQAVVGAHLAAGETGQILVVCPASLRINWAREIAAVRPTDAVMLVGEAPEELLAGARWLVANYERLGVVVRSARLRVAVMIVDEAHYLKEHQSGRTRNAFLLADRVPRRFLLTGTPILSREIEMHTLLRLSGHPLGALDLADFRRRYAGDEARREELAGHIGDWMLRRNKSVLRDLGVKRETLVHVDPCDARGRYTAILRDPALMVMPKIVRLRKTLESFKIDFLLERLRGLAAGDKAIVFCEYVETVELLLNGLAADGIGAVSLVGAHSPGQRQRAIDAFQSNAAVGVFVGTTMAAGVGINLTAANWVYFASLPWTPALKRQAEDRAYRSGQTRDVNVVVPIVPDTIDEQVYRLIAAKQEIEREIVKAVRAGAG
jgi:superfamily II DNA or RNA helicase